MQKLSCIGTVVAIVLGIVAVPAWADDLCPNPAKRAAAKAQLGQAQALQGSGKLREAHGMAEKIDLDCAPGETEQVKKSLAKAIAAEAEQKGQFTDALDWYERAGDTGAAGRVIIRMVQSKPDDIPTVSRAIDFFHSHDDKTQEQTMRALALKNVDNALAAEEKSVSTPLKGSLADLRLAQSWTYYAQAGQDKVRARATLRGDTLAKEDSRSSLKKAMDYYGTSEIKDGIAKVKAKATTLAKQAEAKGELDAAAEYYQIAGEGAKANAVHKQAEASQAKTEDARKKTFQKDQGDLEKALGF